MDNFGHFSLHIPVLLMLFTLAGNFSCKELKLEGTHV